MSWRFSETIVHAMRAGILVLFIDVFQVSGMVPGTSNGLNINAEYENERWVVFVGILFDGS